MTRLLDVHDQLHPGPSVAVRNIRYGRVAESRPLEIDNRYVSIGIKHKSCNCHVRDTENPRGSASSWENAIRPNQAKVQQE